MNTLTKDGLENNMLLELRNGNKIVFRENGTFPYGNGKGTWNGKPNQHLTDDLMFQRDNTEQERKFDVIKVYTTSPEGLICIYDRYFLSTDEEMIKKYETHSTL